MDLCAKKPVWVEPHGATELDESIRDYQAAIAQGHGGMYIAVCRGKVSEGINFSDGNARAVVVLGIPFPNYKDAKVQLKKTFNSAPTNQQRGLISGNDWYNLQAYRAMNQVMTDASTTWLAHNSGCGHMAIQSN
jgi:fanconi anemia group J protein